MILLITSKSDITTDYLIKNLVNRNISFFRFNIEDIILQYDVSILISSGLLELVIHDKIRNTTIKSNDIIGAYFMKPQLPTFNKDDLETEVVFQKTEITETLRSIWRIIPEKKWLNHPENLWCASNKIKQLILADKIGFNIPETLLSTIPKEIAYFYNKYDKNVIIKAVKHGFLLHNNCLNLILTSKLEEADIDYIYSQDSVHPSLIQPNLDKEFDIRVTVIGNSVYATRILSQMNIETKIDWRSWGTISDVNLPHERHKLPADIENKCIEINNKLNLNFSCIDLVMTNNGTYYFLEINPNGQWVWIEELMGYPISNSILDLLSKET